MKSCVKGCVRQVSSIDVQPLQSCVRLMLHVGERLCEVDVSEDSVGEKLCLWLCEAGV